MLDHIDEQLVPTVLDTLAAPRDLTGNLEELFSLKSKENFYYISALVNEILLKLKHIGSFLLGKKFYVALFP